MSMLTYGESLDEETRDNVLQECSADYDEDDDDQKAIAAGAVRLNVGAVSIDVEAVKARKLRSKYGDSGMHVRLRTDIAWSAHDDMWPLLKLKTLCGVYAGIGNRQTQRLNHRLLRAYCAGHSSPKKLKETQLVPTSSLRYWLEQLWFDNLYQFCLHGRERWYSNSCKDDLALARIVKAKQQTHKHKSVTRTDDV